MDTKNCTKSEPRLSRRRLPGGYIFREQVEKAYDSNQAARRALQTIVDEQANGQRAYYLLTEAALQLAKGLEALREIERIMDGKNEK
jgi:hypothetical protein